MGEEAAQFIQPECLVYVLGRLRQFVCQVSVDRDGGIGSSRMCEGVVEGFEVFGELEGRVDLACCQPCTYACAVPAKRKPTSERSTSGGPSAISSALVPGRILRSAAWSRLLKSFCCSGEAGTGDSWSSGMGGGLGRRGDAGDVITADEYDRPGRESGRRNYVEGGV